MTHEQNARIAQAVQMLTAQLGAAKVHSSGPTSGTGSVCSVSVSGPPNRSMATAFMVFCVVDFMVCSLSQSEEKDWKSAASAGRSWEWFGVWDTAHRPPPAEPGRGVTDDRLAVAEAGDPEVERGQPDSHTPTVVSASRPADPPPV